MFQSQEPYTDERTFRFLFVLSIPQRGISQLSFSFLFSEALSEATVQRAQ